MGNVPKPERLPAAMGRFINMGAPILGALLVAAAAGFEPGFWAVLFWAAFVLALPAAAPKGSWTPLVSASGREFFALYRRTAEHDDEIYVSNAAWKSTGHCSAWLRSQSW